MTARAAVGQSFLLLLAQSLQSCISPVILIPVLGSHYPQIALFPIIPFYPELSLVERYQSDVVHCRCQKILYMSL